MKFVTEDDIWGIRRAVRILWDKNYPNLSGNKELAFNAFFNQQIPEVWRETLATVKRHAQDIERLLLTVDTRIIWYKRNGQLNTANLYRAKDQFMNAIKEGEVELPTYMEIEEEKQRWQSHPQYIKDRGYSCPIEEELIQIRIHK